MHQALLGVVGGSGQVVRLELQGMGVVELKWMLLVGLQGIPEWLGGWRMLEGWRQRLRTMEAMS